MKLEVISNSPATPCKSPPILLIHGAWHGGWCWKNNFLDFFAEKGWETHAMSLRGHGQSEGSEKIRGWSIADYVADVRKVVDSLRCEPIIIGHSMGGFVTQKYLEKYSAVAAILLASVPTSGTFKFNIRVIRRHPLLWLKANLIMKLYPIVKNPMPPPESGSSPTAFQMRIWPTTILNCRTNHSVVHWTCLCSISQNLS